MAQQWATAQLEEIEEVSDGRCPLRSVRHHFGITTFGVTSWTAHAEGDRLLNEHDEDPEEPDSAQELYFVVSGAARFELDGEPLEVGAGGFVSVEPGVTRTAFALSAGTTVLAIGGAPPGQVYRAHGWDVWAPLQPLAREGRHEEVVERGKAIAASAPQYGGFYYNLACSESLLGRREDALADLLRAVELLPEAASFARTDDDFAAIRDDPEFATIVGGETTDG